MRRHRVALVLPAILMAAGAAVACRQAPPAQHDAVRIRVGRLPGLEPAQEPGIRPHLAVLDGQGTARVLIYDPYVRRVVAVHEGRLEPARLKRLLAATRSDELHRAFVRRSFDAGDVSDHGETFSLTVQTKNGTEQWCGGFLHRAPAEVRTLVEEVSGLWRELEAVEPAEAYMLSAEIAEPRLSRLREAGRLRFFELDELPEALRPAIEQAVARPGEFHPITAGHHGDLLPFCSHGWDFFVLGGQRGHQVHLFLGGT